MNLKNYLKELIKEVSMTFFELFEQAEKFFYDYLEYGNVVKKNLTLSFKPRNYSDDDE